MKVERNLEFVHLDDVEVTSETFESIMTRMFNMEGGDRLVVFLPGGTLLEAWRISCDHVVARWHPESREGEWVIIDLEGDAKQLESVLGRFVFDQTDTRQVLRAGGRGHGGSMKFLEKALALANDALEAYNAAEAAEFDCDREFLLQKYESLLREAESYAILSIAADLHRLKCSVQGEGS